MLQVFLRDGDGQPVFPLELKVHVVPSRGDRITWWDSGTPEQGGLGMTAMVDHVAHGFSRVGTDHQVFIVLKDIQTLGADGTAYPPKKPSNSDAVGQSDGPEGRAPTKA